MRRVEDGSEQLLALDAAAGDGKAFAALLDRHYDRFYRLAWRLVGNRADAEDVAQDVCVKLATAIRSFRGDCEFGTWAWRIAYNAAADRLRFRARSLPTDPAELTIMADSVIAPEVEDLLLEVAGDPEPLEEPPHRPSGVRPWRWTLP